MRSVSRSPEVNDWSIVRNRVMKVGWNSVCEFSLARKMPNSQCYAQGAASRRPEVDDKFDFAYKYYSSMVSTYGIETYLYFLGGQQGYTRGLDKPCLINLYTVPYQTTFRGDPHFKAHHFCLFLRSCSCHRTKLSNLFYGFRILL